MLSVIPLICTIVLAKNMAKATDCNPPIDGCSTCTGTGDGQTCTGCTAGDQKVQPNGKGCIAGCPPNSDDVGGICTCKSTHKPSDNGQTCVPKTDCNPPIDGCSTCTGTGDGQTCTGCTAGDQKVQPNGKGCIAGCPPNSDDVGGICTCKSTHKPSDNGQTCVPSNTNKSSGLSTGAIAGIAVAAVIVVGGLVGFLCWWFLCRGKA
ncbi:VSP [Giardia duodenalis]|uniref:VSP n=1 Tax=Giardia intestinalis (strain ATCC 50803 / WB clone C6) TaxID=184922 RepID=A8BQX2_GIAIC|nr:VSP [Giardia intestinalis]KAE8304928.1 VSP [Giardia intestinalis]|eukprot:XP_001705510.1 VSP [Giardia lamblia ATCC 50803]